MNRKIKPLAFPCYPLLVGIYAVLFLWSVNVGQVIAAVTVRSLLVSVGLSLVVYLACFTLLKKFIYAHFYSTHEPFVFDQDGNYTPAAVHYSEQGCAPAVAYTSQRILSLVGELIQKSAVRPVIIIQADHGMHTGLSHNKILNAYYFPDQDYSRLYSTITPVNTFRVVLDQFFQRSYPLLPDTLLVKDVSADGQVTVRYVAAGCDLR